MKRKPRNILIFMTQCYWWYHGVNSRAGGIWAQIVNCCYWQGIWHASHQLHFANSPAPVHFNSPPTVLNIAFLHAVHEAKYRCISQHYDSTVQEKQFLKCKYLCKYFAKYADCAGFERMVLLAQQHIPLHHRINGQGAYLDLYVRMSHAFCM